MNTIKQILNLNIQFVSNLTIDNQIGVYKGTLNWYLQKLKFLYQSIDELLKLEEPMLEKLFSAQTPAYLPQRYVKFKPLVPYIEKELGHKHVTHKLLWEEYHIDHPDGYGYSQFCYHFGQLSAAVKIGKAILKQKPFSF